MSRSDRHAATPPLRVALGEYDTGWHDPELSLARAAALVERAVAAGAALVVLPEMATTGFTMTPERHAEPRSGRSAARLAELAHVHGVHLIAGMATRTDDERGRACWNSALVFGPDGALRAEYRKQRLFGYGGEQACYAAGRGPVVADVGGVRVAPFICYDLRFPELFRAVAADVDALVVIANWPAERRPHWDLLVRARAVENQCYIVAVNRTGTGGGLVYDGGSVIYDPWGDRLATADVAGAGVAWADLDPAVVANVRARYPFLADFEAAGEAFG